MPNVSEYDDKDKWMGACMPAMLEEGKEQDEAAAACNSIWENKTSTGKKSTEEAAALLRQAIELHQGHMDGEIPTDEASQGELMELIEDALSELSEKKSIKAGARHSAQDREDMQTLHNIAVKQGAECKPMKKGKNIKSDAMLNCLLVCRECLRICRECMNVCTSCPNYDATHAECAASCQACIDACAACQKAADEYGLDSPECMAACEACILACETCAKSCLECAQECAFCASICDYCLQACNECIRSCKIVTGGMVEMIQVKSLDEEYIYPGDAVKATSLDGGAVKLGGYLIRFGDANNPDLAGDYFTKNTDFGDAKQSDTWFNHRLPIRVKKHRSEVKYTEPLSNKATLTIDDVGVFAEVVIEARNEYEKTIAELGLAAKLAWSSGTASHLVDRKAIKGGVWEITRWRLGLDASLTPTPAEYRKTNQILPIKSLLTADNAALTDTADKPNKPINQPITNQREKNIMEENEIKSAVEKAVAAALAEREAKSQAEAQKA